MKKILLPLIGLAALAACTKSEVQYEPAGEIGFAPVASNVTKSVAGYDGDTFDGVFPTGINLYVFANAGEGTTYSSTSHDEPYFKNALFKYDSSKGETSSVTENNKTINTVGAYAGEPARYWPNVKTLVFAGYSDACGVGKTTPTMDFESNVLKIQNYTQNNSSYTEEGSNDLMWFPCDGTAYGKQTKEIVAKMKHACSWITINVYGDDVTAKNWTLNSLLVKGINQTGNAACGETSATWTSLTNANDEYYYNNGTAAITTTATEYAAQKNNFIVIPQKPTTLDVTYTYTSDATNNLNFTETKNVSLSYGKDNDGKELKWQSGVHYIYNVKITATEILIDPVVVDWDVYDADSNTSDVDDPVNVGI